HQRGFDHVTGQASILADQHPVTVVAAAKNQPHRLSNLERQFRRDRAVRPATDTVGTEIFSSHASPSPRHAAFTADDRLIASNLQKKRGVSAGMDLGRARRDCGAPKRLDLLFSLSITAGRCRLSDVDRIGGGKAVLETLFERVFELALTRLFAFALALVVELVLDGLFWNCHACFSLRSTRVALRVNNALGIAGVPHQGQRLGDWSSRVAVKSLFPDS